MKPGSSQEAEAWQENNLSHDLFTVESLEQVEFSGNLRYQPSRILVALRASPPVESYEPSTSLKQFRVGERTESFLTHKPASLSPFWLAMDKI